MQALQRVQPYIAQSPEPEQQQQSMPAAPAKQTADRAGAAPSAEAPAEAAAQTADTAAVAASSDASAAQPALEAGSGPSIPDAPGMSWRRTPENLPAMKNLLKSDQSAADAHTRQSIKSF